MRAGYHVDRASGFPFAALGLPDNSAVPLPSLWRFGFESDETFREAADSRLAMGIDGATGTLADRAHFTDSIRRRTGNCSASTIRNCCWNRAVGAEARAPTRDKLVPRHGRTLIDG